MCFQRLRIVFIVDFFKTLNCILFNISVWFSVFSVSRFIKPFSLSQIIEAEASGFTFQTRNNVEILVHAFHSRNFYKLFARLLQGYT